MDIEKIRKALTEGEHTRVEFKSCRDKVSNSVYDTVCSFSNHSGGLIILGFDDDMNLVGVNKNASVNLKKNIINTLGNKEVFFPKLTIEPEIEEYEGKTIILIDVPVGSILFDTRTDTTIESVMQTWILPTIWNLSSVFLKERTRTCLRKG